MVSRIVIGALCAVPAVLAGRAEAQCSIEGLRRIVAADAEFGDAFGSAVDIDGDVAIVGVPLSDDNGLRSGSAYVFRFNGSEWVQEDKLVPADNVEGDQFGYSVAIDGNLAAVGAWLDSDAGALAGSVYVYRYNGATWDEEVELVGSSTETLDRFGQSVDISVNRVIAGAPRDAAVAANGGRVFVFRFNGVSWIEEAALAGNDSGSGDAVGTSVSIDGLALAFGAPGDSPVAQNSGSAYVFRRSGGSWSQEAKVFDPAAGVVDNFGEALSLDGDVLLVGAPRHNSDAGAAYVYRSSAGAWPFEAKVTDAGGQAGDLFGSAVAVSGGRAVVAAERNDDLALFAGSVDYLEFVGGGVWETRYQAVSPFGDSSDNFGFGVGLSGDVAIAGSPGDGGEATGAGAAFLLDTDCPCADAFTYCTGKVTSCGVTPSISFSGAPSIAASSGFTISGSRARKAKTGIVLYTGDGPAAIPFQGGTLCLFPSLKRSAPVVSTGGSGGPVCDATFDIDWNAFVAGALGGNPAPFLQLVGKTVNVQWWGRDSVANGSYLSDGLQYDVCP